MHAPVDEIACWDPPAEGRRTHWVCRLVRGFARILGDRAARMKRRLVFGVIFSIVVALAACSRDRRPESTTPPPTTSTTSSTAPPTPTTPVTEPAGTDQAAMAPILQALIDRYDTAVAAILVDPRVASKGDHEAVVSYLGLFAPDSAFAEGAVRSWTREGERGRFYRPGPRGRLTQSTVMAVTSSSADEVTFGICAVNSIEITDAAGAVIEAQGGQTAASVVAVRVGGAWLLRDLTQASATDCPRPAPGQ